MGARWSSILLAPLVTGTTMFSRRRCLVKILTTDLLHLFGRRQKSLEVTFHCWSLHRLHTWSQKKVIERHLGRWGHHGGAVMVILVHGAGWMKDHVGVLFCFVSFRLCWCGPIKVRVARPPSWSCHGLLQDPTNSYSGLMSKTNPNMSGYLHNAANKWPICVSAAWPKIAYNVITRYGTGTN